MPPLDYPCCQRVPVRRLPTAPQRTSGFTLLELLVVITIITILAALVMSAIGRAMRNAKAAQCCNNLKQWSCAFLMYGFDHEFIPREGCETDGEVGQDTWQDVQDPVSDDVWYNALADYLGKGQKSAADYAREGRQGFYRDRLFHCPVARFVEGVAEDDRPYFSGVAEHDRPYFSLAMNSKLILPPTSPPAFSIKLASIREPAGTVAFLDERVSPAEPTVHPKQAGQSSLGQPSAYASRFAARHGINGNLSFCDGHVKSWRGDKVVETRDNPSTGEAIFYPGKAIFPGDVIWCAEPLQNPNGN